MTHPYRTPPAPERARGVAASLALPTVMFGLACGITGQAIGGPRCCLFATVAGVMLLLLPRAAR